MSAETYGTGAILGFIIGVLVTAVGTSYQSSIAVLVGTVFLTSAVVCSAVVFVETRRATMPATTDDEQDQEIHTEPEA